jgi:hypothetical protein
LLDAMLVDAADPDPPPEGLPTRSAPTLMEGHEGRVRVAGQVLELAATLGSP